MRLSVTHWRVLIVVLNLVLTIVVGGHAIYRFTHSYAEPDRHLEIALEQPLKGFEPSDGNVGPRRDIMSSLRGFGTVMFPAKAPPPPPPQPTQPEQTEETEVTEIEGGYQTGGPLEDKYAYVSYIYFGPGNENNMAVLEEVSDDGSSSRRPTYRGSYRSSSRSSSRRRPVRRPTPRGNDSQKVLLAYDRVTIDEEAEEYAWIKDVTPEALFYVVFERGKPMNYAMLHSSESIYVVGDDGSGRVEPIKDEEEAEEGAEGEEEDKTKKFRINLPLVSRKQVFLEAMRNRGVVPSSMKDDSESFEASSGKPGTGSSTPESNVKGVTPGSSARTPRMTAEQRRESLQKMKSTLKSIDRSELSEKDREGLEKIEETLGGKSSQQ